MQGTKAIDLTVGGHFYIRLYDWFLCLDPELLLSRGLNIKKKGKAIKLRQEVSTERPVDFQLF